MRSALRQVKVSDLMVAYLEDGKSDGWPLVLSHGFPYDVRAFDDLLPMLVDRGARVIRPYLRGYEPTSFLSPSTMRSGQQAALGRDLIEVVDALDIPGVILAGFDWGGLASCVATALWPEKIGGLVSYAGYDIVDVEARRRASHLPWRKRCGTSIFFKRSGVASLSRSRANRSRRCSGTNDYQTGTLMKGRCRGRRKVSTTQTLSIL